MKTEQPWEHPHWYDLHDTTHTAGPAREPEHYYELLLALPPLDHDDHLVDVGAGTGKLALLIANGYPNLGHVTLLDPNAPKLELAQQRLRQALPTARIETVTAELGSNEPLALEPGSVVAIGSVLMPIMLLRGGTLADGLAWLRKALDDVSKLAQPEGWVYALETLGAPWDLGTTDRPVRRLNLLELQQELERAQFKNIECVYRFRDRVVIRGQKSS